MVEQVDAGRRARGLSRCLGRLPRREQEVLSLCDFTRPSRARALLSEQAGPPTGSSLSVSDLKGIRHESPASRFPAIPWRTARICTCERASDGGHASSFLDAVAASAGRSLRRRARWRSGLRLSRTWIRARQPRGAFLFEGVDPLRATTFRYDHRPASPGIAPRGARHHRRAFECLRDDVGADRRAPRDSGAGRKAAPYVATGLVGCVLPDGTAATGFVIRDMRMTNETGSVPPVTLPVMLARPGHR